MSVVVYGTSSNKNKIDCFMVGSQSWSGCGDSEKALLLLGIKPWLFRPYLNFMN
jgi:hypothetical protein